MMSTPYFRSYWGVPSSPLSKPTVRMASPKPKASSKVVSIPVQFVGSERNRSDSALMIQKALRGFLVRKSLRKIIAISNEVHQMERRISDHEIIDLIRRDSRERLRISETLMNLLLKLDSVTSVDFGVKGCRKSVIKKAIALQERLDVIASTPGSHDQGHGGVEVEKNSNVVSKKVNSDLHDEAGDYGRSEGISEFPSLVKQEDDEVMAIDNASVNSKVMSDSEVLPENQRREASAITVNPPPENETITENRLEEGPKDQFLHDDAVETRLAGEQPGTCKTAGIASVEEAKEINSSPEITKSKKRNMVACESEEAARSDGRREQNRDRELFQRMIEDNERMMGLMAELFERNEIQTRLLSSLSERVQKLEKAFACEKLRRKKRNAASATDGSDKLPDTKKCDKKQ